MTSITEMPFKERNVLWLSKFHHKVLEQNMQLQQGKGSSLGLLLLLSFPPRVFRRDLYCVVGVSGSLESDV